VAENPYAAYSESSMMGASPLQLVTRSYEGAIGAVQQAKQCFASGDIMGRSKAITKAVSILTELMISLDHQKGGNQRNLEAAVQLHAAAFTDGSRAEDRPTAHRSHWIAF
jgi:flagellar biosynthetic protein FliS